MSEQMTRQVLRRQLFDERFGRLSGKEVHTRRPQIGTDSDGRKIYGSREVIHLPRADRRKIARAFAVGDWRNYA